MFQTIELLPKTYEICCVIEFLYALLKLLVLFLMNLVDQFKLLKSSLLGLRGGGGNRIGIAFAFRVRMMTDL